MSLHEKMGRTPILNRQTIDFYYPPPPRANEVWWGGGGININTTEFYMVPFCIIYICLWQSFSFNLMVNYKSKVKVQGYYRSKKLLLINAWLKIILWWNILNGLNPWFFSKCYFFEHARFLLKVSRFQRKTFLIFGVSLFMNDLINYGRVQF